MVHSSQALKPTARALLELLDRAGYLTQAEGEAGIAQHGQVVPGGWTLSFQTLIANKEAFVLRIERNHGLWVSNAQLPKLLSVLPNAQVLPWLPERLRPVPESCGERSLIQLVRSRRQLLPTLCDHRLASELLCSADRIQQITAISRNGASPDLNRQETLC